MIGRLRSLAKALRLLSRPELVESLADELRYAAELRSLREQHPDARISRGARFSGLEKGKLTLGVDAIIEAGTLIDLGDDLNGYGSLTVGSRTWIGEYNNIRLAGGRTIIIGADCLISQFVTIIAANHDTRRDVVMRAVPPAPGAEEITIGNDCWLGAGVTVLPGTSISDGVVVGANSVARGRLETYGIYAGSPAVRIGERRPDR